MNMTKRAAVRSEDVSSPKKPSGTKEEPVPRLAPLPVRLVPQSESEKLAEGGLSVPQTDYPDKPEVPEFEMPTGPDIMPFSYQRLLFKNAPNDRRMGLALYVTLNDPKERKLAYVHRTYLQQLTTFLASKYDYNVIQSDEGKRRFIEMLAVRFKRRAKGDLIKRLDYAYFDPENEE